MSTFTNLVQSLRTTFASGKTRPYEFRRSQLEACIKLMRDNVEKFEVALYADLGRSRFEANAFDITEVEKEAICMANNLYNYMQPMKVSPGIVHVDASAYHISEPYGVCLIIGPWNYPISLVLVPMLSAIAAGNCCIVKPSEISSNCSRLMADLIPKYLDPDVVSVVEGDVPVTTSLLQEKYDKIFFTGSSTVGKIVYQAAAKHMTPVVLELGGKSPVYVDGSMDMSVIANRVLWGKLINGGQTCIAVDYILVKKGYQEKLISCLKKSYDDMYKGNSMENNCAKSIDKRNFERVRKLMKAGKVEIGGRVDEKANKIEFTVLSGVTSEDPVMQEEIFGPILPIMEVEDEDEAISIIQKGEKPLALYIFTTVKRVQEAFLNRTSSGGVTINHCVVHFSVSDLAFGGVGNSGIGAYHGKYSFDAFSHKKAVLHKARGMDFLYKSILYPPFNEVKLSLYRRMCMPMLRARANKLGFLAWFVPVAFLSFFAFLI